MNKTLFLTLMFAGTAVAGPGKVYEPITPLVVTEHRGSDDLLTAGLGATGLRNATPPAVANPEQPTPAESRQRAVWANWRGIADLSPGGGYGEFYGSLAPVPGREYHAWGKLPMSLQPHHLMVQVPDNFDAGKRCVVVAASSGSRGIYGAISLAGGWGLARGCAVAYTDKGAGTDPLDPPEIGNTAESPIAIKHAHSRDNPEFDWGRHVRQAAEAALRALDLARPADAPFTPANTRIIALGVSNGGGAVLRAAELEGELFDGVVAVSPNIWAGEGGGRALYDYATEAALWMPCALNAPAFDAVAMARPGGARSAGGQQRCASLATAGKLKGDSPEAQAEAARQHLLKQGWTDAALAAGAISSAFDLWRAVAVTYASAYARTGPDHMPCGYAFHALGADGKPRAQTRAERAAWASDSAGIPPGNGIAIVDSLAAGADPALPGLQCLRELRDDKSALAKEVRAGIHATRARPPRAGLPILVVHGIDDGLVPEAFSSGAYARWARKQGAELRYWRVQNVQHFDAFLGLPALGARYLPLMPYGYRAMDAMWAHVADGKPLPADAEIATTPRLMKEGGLAPLRAEDLGAIP